MTSKSSFLAIPPPILLPFPILEEELYILVGDSFRGFCWDLKAPTPGFTPLRAEGLISPVALVVVYVSTPLAIVEVGFYKDFL